MELTINGKSYTIPAGALEVEVPIEIFEGDGFEPDEDAVFRIATVSQATIGNPSVLTLTITEENEPPTVQFVTSGQSVDESGVPAPARLYLSNAWNTNIVISFSIAVINSCGHTRIGSNSSRLMLANKPNTCSSTPPLIVLFRK